MAAKKAKTAPKSSSRKLKLSRETVRDVSAPRDIKGAAVGRSSIPRTVLTLCGQEFCK